MDHQRTVHKLKGGRNMKKRLLAVLTAGALAASLLAGCGGSAASTSEAAPAAEEEKTKEAEAPAEEAPAEEESFVSEPVGDDTIKIWVADNVVDLTKEYAENSSRTANIRITRFVSKRSVKAMLPAT